MHPLQLGPSNPELRSQVLQGSPGDSEDAAGWCWLVVVVVTFVSGLKM